ncbi:unnamed protein product [Polarella glacialis]|uniref:EF-hand domain-containing protein n=1 Tax=Polarella glacialis TaxID=89957 RepID=A0A813EYB2_POLGL|nr:unnamed protein product [Polarella glacialis]
MELLRMRWLHAFLARGGKCWQQRKRPQFSDVLRPGSRLTAGGLLLGVSTFPAAPTRCDASANQLKGAALAQDMIKLRGVVTMLQSTTGLDPETFLATARLVYEAAVGPDGTLKMPEMEQMLSEASKQRSHGWEHVASAVAVSESATVFFRLLDADGDGCVTVKEFLLGQALIYAAAKAKGEAELAELCWRALDVDGSGAVDAEELKVLVRLMVQVGSVEPRDMKEKFAEIKRTHGPPMPLKRLRSVEELTHYYMEMYDANHDGNISWEEFCRHDALRKNFWRLLSSPDFDIFFLVN